MKQKEENSSSSLARELFFNLLYSPQDTGIVPCFLTFKICKEYKERRRDGWHGEQCFLLHHFFALLIYVPVRKSATKYLQKCGLLKVFLKNRINQSSENTLPSRDLSACAGSWKEPLITSITSLSALVRRVVYITTNKVSAWEYVFMFKIDFMLCVSHCKDAFLCIFYCYLINGSFFGLSSGIVFCLVGPVNCNIMHGFPGRHQETQHE